MGLPVCSFAIISLTLFQPRNYLRTLLQPDEAAQDERVQVLAVVWISTSKSTHQMDRMSSVTADLVRCTYRLAMIHSLAIPILVAS